MSVGTFSIAYHRAMEGLFKLGYYTVSASIDPEAQYLRHPTRGGVWVTELPEQNVIRIEMCRYGHRVSQFVSMEELVCIDPMLLDYLMQIVIKNLEGTLEPLQIPIMM